MPWTHFYDSRGGQWRYDALGLWILTRQHVYNQLLRERSRVVRDTRWFGPDLARVETNFTGINVARDAQSYPLFLDLEQRIAANPQEGFSTLVRLRDQTEANVLAVRRMQQEASGETSRNIEQSISRAQTGIEVATFVRNLSASVLVVGSAFLTGGAAVAVLGGGSAMRGVGTYQDTGNVGSAILNTAGTFVVGAIPLAGGSLGAGASVTARVGGEAINYGERAVLVVVGSSLDATFEGTRALMEGRNGRQAINMAVARFGIDVLSGGFGTRLDTTALPVALRLVTDTMASVEGDRMVERARTFQAPDPLPRAAPAAPARTGPMPQPTRNFCDANAVLSTGSCSSQDWVRQIVLSQA
jgi:hypothetical protein